MVVLTKCKDETLMKRFAYFLGGIYRECLFPFQDESTEFPISEGEFQYNPAIAPEKDPVLLLLSRLQHGPIHPGQLDMTSAQVSDLLDYTGNSLGRQHGDIYS